MESERMLINGVAVRPGISKNGITYTSEELKKFSQTFKNRPILKDHRSEVDNTYGLVTSANVNNLGIVSYSGWIKDDGKGLFERIKDGRAKEVSIGAYVGRLVESEDGELIATNMEAMELSLTPTPGVTGTSIQQSLENYKQKGRLLPVAESFNEVPDSLKKQEEEVIQMAEEAQEKAPEQKEEIKEEVAEETKKPLAFEVDSSSIDRAIEKSEKLLALKQKIKESEEAEQEKATEEPKAEEKMKGKVEEKKESGITEDSDLVVESSEYGNGYQLWKMPKADGSYL
jgi:hypothetical protein